MTGNKRQRERERERERERNLKKLWFRKRDGRNKRDTESGWATLWSGAEPICRK